MKALAGIKIVNIGFNLPGPLVSFHLQKLGATVVKVNPPKGDPLFLGSPEFYNYLCKDQKIAVLDLKNETDRKTLNTHLKEVDLVITSSRPESLQRISMDWLHLHKDFPRLCHLNIVGFAHPHQNRAGHDLTYQASAGLLRPPQMPLTCIADFAGAHEASLGAVAMLFQREKTGVAQNLEVSLTGPLELYATLLKYGLTTTDGPLGGRLPEYGIYKSKEGWVAVAVLESHFKNRFMAELGLAHLKHDDIKKVMLEKTAAEWEKWAMEKDLPLAAVREY